MTTVEENAHILLREITEAFERGTRHFNKAGRELTTPKEIIETLLTEGAVTLGPARPSERFRQRL